MAQAAIDYVEILEAEISQTPSEYLPILANIVHAFRESVNAKAASEPLLPWQIHAIEEGLAAAQRGEYATDEEVKARFAKWGVNVEG